MTALGCAVTVLLLGSPTATHAAAIMVQQTINLNGNGVTVDSYNSIDPARSVNGMWSPATSGDAGDVVCVEGITNSFPVGNANIYGRVFAASTSTIGIGPNGAVGTHDWQASNGTGIAPGFLSSNTNFPFTNVIFPDTTGFIGPTIPGGTVVTTNYGIGIFSNFVYLSTNTYDSVLCGNYYSTGMLGNIAVTCPSVLVQSNGFSYGNITMLPGASLTIYAGGNNVSLSGNAIVNDSPFPSSFVVFCASSVTNIFYAGNAGFVGVIIAPTAAARLLGGGNDVQDFSGAIMARSLTMFGNFNIHFDEALIQEGIIPAFPSIAASLSQEQISGAGQFEFNVFGADGLKYVVESSTDFLNWQSVFTNVSPFTFTDTNAAANQNFYRAVYNP